MLLREQFADRFQFLPALRGSLGIDHVHSLERIKENVGHDQPGILLIIGGHDVPGGVMGTGRSQARLVRLSVLSPVASFVKVREAEFPILVGVINTRQKALSLFLLRQVKKNLDDSCAVTIEMVFQIHNGAISPLPDRVRVHQRVRQPLGA